VNAGLFNACDYLLDRHVREGRGGRLALTGTAGDVSYAELNSGDAADEETLIGFCKTGLPSFKRPRRIVFVTEYPATATGKIRRVELRAEAAVILQDEMVAL
jgi:acyl-CoA synthetase (AMP-forming)/AMP-acid ligase II